MASSWVGDGVAAAGWAGLLSGGPSTAVSLATGENLLDSSAAAGPCSSPSRPHASCAWPPAAWLTA